MQVLSTFFFLKKNLAPYGYLCQGRLLCCSNNHKISGNLSILAHTPHTLQAAVGFFQVILTLGPKYRKWPWQGAQNVVKHALAPTASAQK